MRSKENKIIVRTNRKYIDEKKYIIDVIFNDVYGLDVEILFDDEVVGFEIILSNNESIKIPSVLFEFDEVDWLTKKTHPNGNVLNKKLEVNNKIFNNVQLFYHINQNIERYDLEFDLLGAIFFFLTNYEEVNCEEVDEYGRFNYKESILYKLNLLKRPVVNEYLEILWQYLCSKCDSIKRKKHTYQLIVSHDIDMPLASNYSYFNFFRSLAADIFIRKSLLVASKRIISKLFRIPILDPNFNFDKIMNISEKHNLVSSFNFIVIDGQRGIDGAYDFEQKVFDNVLLDINRRGHIIGIHPSYNSFDNSEIMSNEFNKFKNRLNILGIKQDIISGRQHYLRFKTPITWSYWDLNGAGIDSTVGSEYFIGFKNGMCFPYKTFDLYRKKALNLVEYPLIAMDVAFFKIGGFDKYFPEIVELSKVVKKYNGVFTLLYHNNYLITSKQRNEYERLLKAIL